MNSPVTLEQIFAQRQLILDELNKLRLELYKQDQRLVAAEDMLAKIRTAAVHIGKE